jgi:hypothetical protein
MTPYERGLQDGKDLKPAPPFSRPDTPWSGRLYARGWSDGVDARLAADREARLTSGMRMDREEM